MTGEQLNRLLEFTVKAGTLLLALEFFRICTRQKSGDIDTGNHGFGTAAQGNERADLVQGL